MSTAATHSDLDRTDVLPPLDVAAYEAELKKAGVEVDASETATYSLAQLRDAEAEEAAQEQGGTAATQRLQTSGELVGLLERIDRLETELATLRSESAGHKRTNAELTQQRAQADQRQRELQGEVERLAEQRDLTRAHLESLTERHRQELALLREQRDAADAARLAAHTQVDRELAELRAKLSSVTAALDSARRERAEVERTIEQQAASLAERDSLITELRTAHAEQERAAAHLARLLASRISEQQVATAEQKHRDAIIKDLERTQAQLRDELQGVQNAHAQVTRELASTSQALSDALNRSVELERHVADSDAHAGKLQRDLDAARAERDAHGQQVSAVATQAETAHADLARLQALANSQREELGLLQRSLHERLNQVSALETRIESLQSENETLTARLSSSNAESAQAPPVSDLTVELRTDYETIADTVVRTAAYTVASDVPQMEGVPVEDRHAQFEAQALELAATRAELQRHARVQEDFERSLRARDELLHTLRAEVQTAQEERGILALQLQKARTKLNEMAERLFEKDARIAELRAGNEIGGGEARSDDEPPALLDPSLQRVLEPVGHDAPAVPLDRKIMTVGRTEDSDVCVPSKLVSRHHARLLVGAASLVVIDASSTNGCYVNDREIKKETVRDGDILRFGDRAYRFTTRQREVAEPKDYSAIRPR